MEAVLYDRMDKGSSGRWIAEYGQTPETLAAAVLDWLRTELAAEGMLRHVTEALVRANNDDCDGYLPLTEADIQTLAVTYEDDAIAALEAVAERLAGGER